MYLIALKKYYFKEIISFINKYNFVSGNFQGDIAIPDVDYFKPTNTAPTTSKINKSLQEEVERLKKEVLLEGLQVEEEGLPDILRKRTKQPLPLSQDKPKKYNEVTVLTKVKYFC